MDEAKRLHALFQSNGRGRGEFRPGEKDERGKVRGATFTRDERGPSVSDWRAHLGGKLGLGVSPLLEDGQSVMWGTIDIDQYPLDHAALERKIAALELPLTVLESKSGGAHLVVFFSEPISAAKVQRVLRDWAGTLGHAGCEIFPKQTSHSGKGPGSWLNMPYFGGERRAMIGGEWVAVGEFLNRAEASKLSAGGLSSAGEPAPVGKFPNGPPCLNDVWAGGLTEGQRNTVFFNIAVMLLKEHGDVDDVVLAMLFDLNRELDNPLPSSEVHSTYKSALRGEYEGYQCGTSPLCDHCDRQTCATRPFGVSSAAPSGWVYVVSLKRFYNLTTHDLVDKEQFDDLFPQKKGRASTAFVKDQGTKVMRLTFQPEAPLFLDDAVNTWTGDEGAKPEPEGDPTPFLDHLKFIVPDPDELTHLMRWLANIVQNPRRRPNHGVMIVGGMGTGKSFIGRLMTEIVGRRYTGKPRTSDVKERFNSWAMNKLLIVIDEVMDLGRQEITQRLKEMVADDWVSIRMMHRDPFEMPNFAAFLVFSNSDDALKLETGERRWFIISSPAVAKPSEYYRDLHRWAEKGGTGAVAHYLRRIDLSDFDPKAVPPRTKAQAEMEAAAHTPDEDAVRDLFERGDFPFNGPVAVIAELKGQLPMLRRNSQWFGKVLGRLGGEKLRQVRLTGLGRPVVYIMRDHAEWAEATDAKIAERWAEQTARQRMLEEEGTDETLDDAANGERGNLIKLTNRERELRRKGKKPEPKSKGDHGMF